MSPRKVTPVVLRGKSVVLQPLSRNHVPALLEALSDPGAAYTYSGAPVPTPEGVATWVEAALAEQEAGTQLPFTTVRRADGQVVGSTRFLRIEHWEWQPGHPYQKPPGFPDVAEIGHTWLAPSARRTGINTEAKYLMLCHAFENWGVHRVALRTDKRNKASRRAIERIGAKKDGMIRADRPGTDGAVRDSAVYSILASEWPDVKEHIEMFWHTSPSPSP